MPCSPRHNQIHEVRQGRSTLQFLCLPYAAWIFGLIWYAGPIDGLLNILLAVTWLCSLLLVSLWMRDKIIKIRSQAALLLFPFLLWFCKQPSHNRDWAPSFEKTSHAVISNDSITIHHFRSFDYAKDGTLTENWTTRQFSLSKLRQMDIAMSIWGSEWFGHPVFSFDFGDEGHCAFTIEARIEKNEGYSIFGGLYRQYELAYIPTDEADAIRVRSHFRDNETVHLYRTVATPEIARKRFLEFLASMNEVHQKPRFYNIITSNCTTAVRSQMTDRFPFDWRIIVNGRLDELLYQRNILVTDGLPFNELRQRALIKPTTNADSETFSDHIRRNRPGFSS